MGDNSKDRGLLTAKWGHFGNGFSLTHEWQLSRMEKRR